MAQEKRALCGPLFLSLNADDIHKPISLCDLRQLLHILFRRGFQLVVWLPHPKGAKADQLVADGPCGEVGGQQFTVAPHRLPIGQIIGDDHRADLGEFPPFCQKNGVFPHLFTGLAGEFLVDGAVKALDVQHHPVTGVQQFGIGGEVPAPVGVQKGGQPQGVDPLEEGDDEIAVEGALPAGDGDPPNKGHPLLDFGQHLLHREQPHLGGGEVGADLDAGVAADAQGGVPADGSRCIPLQGAHRAVRHAGPAVLAEVDGLRVVAVVTAEIAPLKEDGCPVAGAVHTALGDDFVDGRSQHKLLSFRSSKWRSRMELAPRATVSCWTALPLSYFSMSLRLTR